MGQLASALKIAITDQAMLPSKSLCEGAEESAVARVMSIGRELELRAPGHRMSTLQDLESGRPLEVHETFGYALERGAQKGVQMPLVEAFYQVAAALDRLRVAPGAR
jgi:ketopantoate reductase